MNMTANTRKQDMSSRVGSVGVLVAMLAVATGASMALQSPLLVSRFGLRSDVANSIARAVEALGYVPWWALLIIGAGVAGLLVRLVIQYGVRYAAAW